MKKNAQKKLKQFFPWIITLVVFYFLFKKIPPAEVLATLLKANLGLFVFYSVAYFVVMIFIDGLSLRWALSRFSTSVTFKETIFMRGATYLLMLVNYNLGQGSMAFYLKRTHQAPLFKTLGTVFLLTVVDLSWILFFGILAGWHSDLIYRGLALAPLIQKTGALFFTGLFLWILFWQGAHWFQSKGKNPLAFIVDRPLFYAFKTATITDFLIIWLLRLPPILLVMTTFYLWSAPFSTPIPWNDIFVYAPPILVTGTLPITPGGVGAVQALCVEFFKNSIHPVESLGLRGEQILFAGSLLWGMANAVLKIIFGFFCLKKQGKNLFEPTP